MHDTRLTNIKVEDAILNCERSEPTHPTNLFFWKRISVNVGQLVLGSITVRRNVLLSLIIFELWFGFLNVIFNVNAVIWLDDNTFFKIIFVFTLGITDYSNRWMVVLVFDQNPAPNSPCIMENPETDKVHVSWIFSYFSYHDFFKIPISLNLRQNRTIRCNCFNEIQINMLHSNIFSVHNQHELGIFAPKHDVSQ